MANRSFRRREDDRTQELEERIRRLTAREADLQRQLQEAEAAHARTLRSVQRMRGEMDMLDIEEQRERRQLELEDELAIRREELEWELATRREELEQELAGRRSELERQLSERRSDLERSYATRRDELKDSSRFRASEDAIRREKVEAEQQRRESAVIDGFQAKARTLSDFYDGYLDDVNSRIGELNAVADTVIDRLFEDSDTDVESLFREEMGKVESLRPLLEDEGEAAYEMPSEFTKYVGDDWVDRAMSVEDEPDEDEVDVAPVGVGTEDDLRAERHVGLGPVFAPTPREALEDESTGEPVPKDEQPPHTGVQSDSNVATVVPEAEGRPQRPRRNRSRGFRPARVFGPVGDVISSILSVLLVLVVVWFLYLFFVEGLGPFGAFETIGDAFVNGWNAFWGWLGSLFA